MRYMYGITVLLIVCLWDTCNEISEGKLLFLVIVKNICFCSCKY